ncbi:hypothetical protein HY628_01740 [Candidatus Uhrbacteria bacterium]|nr:hypothetical protein [Candidatus Uhrbacteria bacterium]
MNREQFRAYVALGDSLSIGVYPQADLEENDPEATRAILAPDALGAPGLLVTNQSKLFPEFSGRDLISQGLVRYQLLATDGATCPDVLANQLPRLQPSNDADLLITLTVGGNDLLMAFLGVSSLMNTLIRVIRQRYDELVAAIRYRFPRALLILTTVYDPTDDSGNLAISELRGLPAEHLRKLANLPLVFLHQFNRHLRETARRDPRIRLADAQAHFLGHGLSAPPAEQWYWRHSPIEPNLRGASELRRLWLQAIDL